MSNTASCTEQWAAPEVLSGMGKATLKLDIFCLGCIYYYIWTHKHPYGESKVRRFNIMNDKKNDFTTTFLEKHELENLIYKMLPMDPNKRVSAKAVLEHHFFWEPHKKIHFISKIKEVVSNVANKEGQLILSYITTRQLEILQCDDWTSKLEPVMKKYLCKKEKGANRKQRKRLYENCFVDLIQCIRNMYEHIAELPLQIKVLFSNNSKKSYSIE